MVREFELPDIGEGVAEGEIVSWLVEPGDEVSEDQPVAEVETDKAVVEVPSPVNGSVKELHAEAGAVVPVGEVIVTFAVEGEDVEGEDVEDEAVEKDATAESDGEAVETGEEIDTSDAEAADDGAAIPASEGRSSGRVFAAPSARRLARELGVDIGRVEGSGPAGRVSEGDVRAAAGNGQGSPPATKPTASEASGSPIRGSGGRSGRRWSARPTPPRTSPITTRSTRVR